MPELVASLCTLLVLAPLALMPGLGEFLYRPMAAAVAFAMISAYLLSRSFVPSRSASWLKPHAAGMDMETANGHGHEPTSTIRSAPQPPADEREPLAVGCCAAPSPLGGPDRGRHRLVRPAARSRDEPSLAVVLVAVGLLVATLGGLGTQLRREFFPEVDAGAFEIYARAASGTRIEETEKRIAKVEQFVREAIGDDLQIIISELGVVADLSAAYTPNAGPMDAVVKVQLKHERQHSAQEYVEQLRTGFARDPKFRDLEFAFDAGGMIRSAMNEGKSSPINIRLSGKNLLQARRSPSRSSARSSAIDGVVDARIIQRLDYPEYIIEVDRAKVADLGLNQAEVMKNVVAALNSSIQFHKKNFWIDPVSKNQYFVGVQYFEEDIDSVETLLDIPITGPGQDKPIPLRNIATLRRSTVPTEITHNNLQSTIDLTMGVSGRDLGPRRRRRRPRGRPIRRPPARRVWIPYDPEDHSADRKVIKGATIELSGEYSRHAGDLPQPGLRPDPGDDADLLPDGGPVQVVPDAAGDPVRRAAGAGRRGDDALSHGHGHQRAVAAGGDLHGRHRRVEHGAAGRLRPEPPRGGRAWRPTRRSARRHRSGRGRW